MDKKFGRPELIVVEYWMFKVRKKVTSFCGNILPGKFDLYANIMHSTTNSVNTCFEGFYTGHDDI